MFGLGTIINTAAIVLGGILGLLFGKKLKERTQQTLSRTCGICVLFIAIAGAMEGMMSLQENGIAAGKSMLLLACLLPGAVIGELLDIEGAFERFGAWLKEKTGNSGDRGFVDAFVTASFTVCIGAMAIVGSIRDGLTGDWSVLASKAVLDFIIILVMAGAMGKGCIFSAVPVAILQGCVTLLARLIQPVMTPQALAYLSLIGSVLIFCVGVNLVWDKRIRVANLLPAIVLAVVCAFVPVAW